MTQYKKLWLTLVVSIALISPVNAEATLHFWALHRQQANWQCMRIGYVVLRILDFAQTGMGPAAILYFIPADTLRESGSYPDVVPSGTTATHLKDNTATTSPSPSSSAASSFKSQGYSPSSQSPGSFKADSYEKSFGKKKNPTCKEEYPSIIHWGGKVHQMAITFVDDNKNPIARESATRVRLKVQQGKKSTYIPYDQNAYFMAVIDILTTATSSQGMVTGNVTLSGIVRTRIKAWHTRAGDFPKADPLFGVYCNIKVTVTQYDETPNIGFVFTPPGQNDPLTVLQPVPITEFEPHLLFQLDDYIELSNEFALQIAAGQSPQPSTTENEDPPLFQLDEDSGGPLSNSPTTPDQLDQATGTSSHPSTHQYAEVATPKPINELTSEEVDSITSNPGHPRYLEVIRYLRPKFRDFPTGSRSESNTSPSVQPGYVPHQQPNQVSQGPANQPSQAEERRQRRQADYEQVPTPQVITEYSRREIEDLAQDTQHRLHQDARQYIKLAPAPVPISDPLYTPDYTPIRGEVGDRRARTNAELRWLILLRDDSTAQRVMSTRNGEFYDKEDDDLWEIINAPENEEWEKQSAKEELRRRRDNNPLLQQRDAYEEHRFKRDDDKHDPQGGAGLSGLSPSGGGVGITIHTASASKSTNSGSQSYSGHSGYEHQHASKQNQSQFEGTKKAEKAEMLKQLLNIIVPHHLIPAASQSAY